MTKAIFLDRDGVINKEVGYLHEVERLEFIPNSLESIKILVNSSYKIIIVTNQPVIGRGICTEQQYLEFQNHMIKEIENAGGRIDKFYYCPHHPRHGKGDYLKECNCRKPKPGMLLQAKEKFNLDMENSWMIGDSRSDIKVGNVVGCKTILVQTGNAGKGGDTDLDAKPNQVCDNLYAAVELILNR